MLLRPEAAVVCFPLLRANVVQQILTIFLLEILPEPAVLDNFEKFLFGKPVAVTVSFRRKKFQEVPQPPDTFTHLDCWPLNVLTLCILIAFKRKFVKILSNDVSIKF